MMRSWLTRCFIDDPQWGICMGSEFSFHRYLISDLLRIGQLPYQLPSALELSLALEDHLKQLFDENDSEIRQLLGNDKKSRKFQRKLTLLSQEMASLFLVYGTYGHSLIDDWKNNAKNGWQQKLWNKLFEESSCWTYPAKLIQEKYKITPQRPLELHLFGVSYIPPVYHHFLSSITVDFPFTYYILSPTQNFWSDLVTDKQISKILAPRENDQLENLLRDRNPLLANMGKLGRQFIQAVEEYNFPASEAYFIAEKIAAQEVYQEFIFDESTEKFIGEGSLLEHVQGDLLLLRKTEEKIDLQSDHSITIHSAPSIYREVEILYDNILTAMSNKSLEPEEILVMAPDINLYTAAIRAVFDAKKSSFEILFYDLEILSQNRLAKGFFHLLDLADSRWDALFLLELFEQPDFQRGQQLNADDLLLIREWIQKTMIAWGEDKSHRHEILKRYHMDGEAKTISDVGTWKQGIERLLDALAIGDDKLAVEFTQAPLLGRWIGWIKELRQDLKKIEEERTLSNWCCFLRDLLEKYFPQESFDGRSAEEYVVILKMIGQLYSRENAFSLYSWTSVRLRLDRLFEQGEGSSFTRNFNSIAFCSLNPMRGVPAKALFLLGMDDLTFPRRRKISPHNRMRLEKDFSPTTADEDRYLFLEAIISTRLFLTISYTWDSDNKQKAPSILVSEFLDYLDSSYTMGGRMISKSILFHHPYRPYSADYFSGKTPLKSYAEENYKLAKASFAKKTQLPPVKFSLFRSWEEAGFNLSEDRDIDLQKLSAPLRNPIKVYLKQSFGIILDKDEENIICSDEPFLLNRLDLHFWKKELLKASTEEILEKAIKEGKFPSGIFAKNAHEELENCRQYQLKTLETMGINASDIGTLIFDRYALTKNSCDFLLDPLALNIDGFTMTLRGKIEGISSQGLVLDSDSKPGSLMKQWANIHLFHAVCDRLKVDPKVHFLRDQQTWVLEKADPMIKIEQLVKYSLLTENHLVLYLPEWIESWRKENPKALNDLIKKSFTDAHTPFYNREAKWLWRDRPPPQVTEEQFQRGARFVHSYLEFPTGYVSNN